MIARIPLVVTDEDVVRVGHQNPGWHVERIAGELIMTPPSGFGSDVRAAHVVSLLRDWAKAAGGVVSASSGGVKLNNGDLVAPDAAWVDPHRWASLSAEQREKFLPFAPDVAIEVLSESDDLKALTAKCQRWEDGGTGYVVLIDPYRKTIRTWGSPPSDDFPDLTPVMEI